MPTNTLSNRIKKAKLIKGLTHYQLSKLTGLSRSMINELELDIDMILLKKLY